PGGKASEKVMELPEKARNAVSEEGRAPFYQWISRELIDYVPHVMPICMQDRIEGFRDGVSGLWVYPGGGRDHRGDRGEQGLTESSEFGSAPAIDVTVWTPPGCNHVQRYLYAYSLLPFRPGGCPPMDVRARSAIALAVSAALVSACGGGGGGAKGPEAGGTVKNVPVAAGFDKNAEFSWGYTIEVTSFDPHRGSSGFDQNWLFPVYDRLVYSSPDGTLKPMLATSWEVGNGGDELTLTLRDGVTFHDGTPLDATAVKTSLDRARDDESVVKSELTSVKSVEVVDEKTVRLKLSGGAGALLGSLADRAGMIISPAAIKKGKLDSEPVGAGAYTVLENKPGDRVRYGKYDKYWDPSVQRAATMTFRVMSDDQTRLNALQTGELTMALIRQNQVQPAKQMGLNVLSGEGPTFYAFSVNSSRKPFNDPKVRLALNLAMDRKAIGEGLLEGFCTPQIQPWPSTSWAYDKKLGNGLDKWPHDPARAKKLLAEAGYPNGFTFTSFAANITGYQAVAEAVQAQFAKVGVTMKLKVVDPGQMAKQYNIEKSADASVFGYSPTPDPQGVLDRVLLPNATGNPGGKAPERLVELSDKARDAVSEQERAPQYHQIMAQLVEEVPHAVPICMQHRTEAFRDGVSGLSIYPGGGRDYRGVAVGKAN
ncbi:MAG: hypothetical protein GEV11_20660, partial [Streptosporangiales bacterium]|nr:hypothetical protein [Streptosporangiales bacterium]